MRLKSLIASSLGFAVATALCSSVAIASSHREAPDITKSPKLDSTDFYVFRSYETGRENFVTLLANYIPLQDPQGGPNYFSMDPDAVYEIHIDNTGDAIEDLTFQFRFNNSIANNGNGQELMINGVPVAVPLKHIGGIDTASNANLGFNESYSLKMITGDRRTGAKADVLNVDDGGTTFVKPYDNVGDKTFTAYSAYANQYIYNANIPNCATDGKVFVGQRKESFVVNLGETFDLVNYVPIDNSAGLGAGISQNVANDDLRTKNITTIALELPISCVTGADGIIGAWTSASVRQARILLPNKSDNSRKTRSAIFGGGLTQVSRLSNPLVNELVIGLPDKDKFNGSEPKDDGQFATYVTNPTLPELLNILFRDAVNSLTGQSLVTIAPTNFPRNDLVATFLTGFTGVNANGSVAEMLRLNTGIAATVSGSQNAFGVVAGDLAGFPNGRRPGDDVVDLALRVVMGALCHPVDLDGNGVATDDLGLCAPADASVGTVPFTDGAPISASDFDTSFPYLLTPLAGSPN